MCRLIKLILLFKLWVCKLVLQVLLSFKNNRCCCNEALNLLNLGLKSLSFALRADEIQTWRTFVHSAAFWTRGNVFSPSVLVCRHATVGSFFYFIIMIFIGHPRVLVLGFVRVFVKMVRNYETKERWRTSVRLKFSPAAHKVALRHMYTLVLQAAYAWVMHTNNVIVGCIYFRRESIRSWSQSNPNRIWSNLFWIRRFARFFFAPQVGLHTLSELSCSRCLRECKRFDLKDQNVRSGYGHCAHIPWQAIPPYPGIHGHVCCPWRSRNWATVAVSRSKTKQNKITRLLRLG